MEQNQSLASDRCSFSTKGVAASPLDAYAQIRSDGYRILASLLAAPPSAALLEWLKALQLDGLESFGMNAVCSVLQLAASRADQELVEEEYQQLFIGVGRGELMPYGSWYLTGFLMEKPLIALRNDLAELGFERAEEVKEPEDHAAALCEVMAMLCADLSPAAIAQQQAFFDAHLAPWIERFFGDLQNSESAHFYTAVGHFGAQFIARETEFLSFKAGR